MPSSGVAASQLPNRIPQFSCFWLAIALTDQTVSRFLGLSALVKAIKETQVYIWDETTMSLGKAITVIERSLKDMAKSTVDLFGGNIFLSVCLFGETSRFLSWWRT